VCSGASRASNIDAIFFMLGWAQWRSHKKRAMTCDAELLFLHLVRSVGHGVHLGACGA
jgi:hypothetical protein